MHKKMQVSPEEMKVHPITVTETCRIYSCNLCLHTISMPHTVWMKNVEKICVTCTPVSYFSVAAMTAKACLQTAFAT